MRQTDQSFAFNVFTERRIASAQNDQIVLLIEVVDIAHG